MDYPKIGDVIRSKFAIELCTAAGLHYLSDRIKEAKPDHYKPWQFFGYARYPDEVAALFNGCCHTDILFRCVLPHDLCYAYGDVENGVEKHLVDMRFKSNLITIAKMPEWRAHAFYSAASYGGAAVFGPSWEWAFASKRKGDA